MPPLSRRRLLTTAVAFAAVGAARRADACPSRLVVEQRAFTVDGLHPAHHGLRVAQLSDLHVGPGTPRALVREAVAAVNAAQPDLVVLTGDYLVLARSGVGRMREELFGLQAPTVATLGNHDHWVDPAGARRALEGHGYAVLQNASTTLTLRGEPFTVVGVDDLATGHADVPRAFAGARAGSRLVLAHVPRTAQALAARAEPMLVLSGHTHGGQLRVPLLTDALLRGLGGERWVRGAYRVGAVQLYVNRGLGTSGVPLRVGSPPELTLATLRAPVA